MMNQLKRRYPTLIEAS